MAGRLLVGMPAFRGADHIAETLRSIQAQGFKDFDLLISLDAGDEGTAEAAAPFLDDPRIRVVRQERRLHWAGNMNFLFEACDADHFVYHQQDDLMAPDYLQALLDAATSRPDAAVTYPDIRFFGAREDTHVEESIDHPDAFARVMAQVERLHWAPLRGCIPRRALRAAGLIRITGNESFCQDFPWLTALARSGPMLRVPGARYAKRSHDASLSAAWFRHWPEERRRAGLVSFGASLLQAALPAAAAPWQRFALLWQVLDRLLRRPFALPVQRLDAAARATLLRELMAATRQDPAGDPAAAFGLSPARLEALALHGFGLLDRAALEQGATAEERAALAIALPTLRDRLLCPVAATLPMDAAATRCHGAGAWGEGGAEGAWTHGAEAELLLWPAAPCFGDVALHATPFRAPWRKALEVTLAANGRQVAAWHLDTGQDEGPLWLPARLPAEAVRGDAPLRLTLGFPGLEAPEALGLPADAPVLGLHLHALSLR
jgi:GT2 family glycosyltransferase